MLAFGRRSSQAGSGTGDSTRCFVPSRTVVTPCAFATEKCDPFSARRTHSAYQPESGSSKIISTLGRSGELERDGAKSSGENVSENVTATGTGSVLVSQSSQSHGMACHPPSTYTKQPIWLGGCSGFDDASDDAGFEQAPPVSTLMPASLSTTFPAVPESAPSVSTPPPSSMVSGSSDICPLQHVIRAYSTRALIRFRIVSRGSRRLQRHRPWKYTISCLLSASERLYLDRRLD